MKRNKKGFTLAELLIVVAIIAVLVAISIPVFTAQLEKSRLGTNQANARAAYAMATASILNKDSTGSTFVYNAKTATIATTGAFSGISTAITDWSVGTTVGSAASKKAGAAVYNTWKVKIVEGSAPEFLAQ